MLDVTVGGPGLAAVGGTGSGTHSVVWTSLIGITWSRVAHENSGFDDRMNAVTVGGPGLVIVGEGWRADSTGGAVVWISDDAVTWSRVPRDEAVFGMSGMMDLVVNGRGLISVGGFEPPGDLDAAVCRLPQHHQYEAANPASPRREPPNRVGELGVQGRSTRCRRPIASPSCGPGVGFTQMGAYTSSGVWR